MRIHGGNLNRNNRSDLGFLARKLYGDVVSGAARTEAAFAELDPHLAPLADKGPVKYKAHFISQRALTANCRIHGKKLFR